MTNKKLWLETLLIKVIVTHTDRVLKITVTTQSKDMIRWPLHQQER